MCSDVVKENIQNYKELRSDYISAPFEFRKRNASKEIQPMMRFTSKTNFERVANRLKVLMQNPNQVTFARFNFVLRENRTLERLPREQKISVIPLF